MIEHDTLNSQLFQLTGGNDGGDTSVCISAVTWKTVLGLVTPNTFPIQAH